MTGEAVSSPFVFLALFLRLPLLFVLPGDFLLMSNVFILLATFSIRRNNVGRTVIRHGVFRILFNSIQFISLL